MAKVRRTRTPSTPKGSNKSRFQAEKLERRLLLSTDIYIGTANGDGTVGEYTTSGSAVNPALISGLGTVQSIAVTGSTLYVTSSGNTTIGQYTTSGTFLNASFGSGLSVPYGVAVSGSNLLVSNDSSAGYIAEFTTSGAMVNASLVSGLNDPQNIAISGSDLFVTNFASGTVGKYTTSGATVNASLISGLPLDNANPIAISGSDLFVANNGAVAEYTTSGAMVNASLITGLSNPAGIAVSGSDLFVISDDNGNGMLGEYTTAGATVNAALITGLDDPISIAVAASSSTAQLAFAQQPSSGTTTGKLPKITVDIEDSNGNLLTGDKSNVTLTIASGTAGTTLGGASLGDTSLGGTTTVAAVNGVATFSNLSITAVGIYTLTATDGADTAATSTSFQVSPPDSLVGTPGDLFVSGNQADVIYEVNPTTGVIVGEVSANSGSALGLRFDSSGNLYAVDNSDGTLEQYNGNTGSHIGTVASGILDGYGLAIANGDFYVSDTVARQIDVFNSSGTEVNSIATQDFNNLPLGLAISPSGKILVGTQNGSQIDAFNLDGSDPTIFASGSNLAGSAFGLAYGPNGNLYISNYTGNSIMEFNGSTGAYITSITGGGLSEPSGIAFGPSGDLYVANNGNDTISVFAASSLAPVTTFSGFGGVYDVAFNPDPSASVNKLEFTNEPTNTTTDATLPPITVDIDDSSGNVVTSDNSNVTVALSDGAASATLGGTTTVAAVNGVATFSDLTISNDGDDYTLIATDGDDTPATSTSFDILSPSAAQIFVANSGDGTVGGYTSSGTAAVASLISGLGTPAGIALSGSDLFVTDQDGGTIGEYTASGAVLNASLVSGLDSPTGIVAVGADLFVTNAQSNSIGEYTTTGATVNASLVSGLKGPQGIAISGTDLFVTNIDNGTIGEYTTTGGMVNASLVTGLNAPVGIAISGQNLFVTSSTSIGEYTLTGATVNTALITGLASPYGIAVSGSDIFEANSADNTVGEYTTSGATVNASLIAGLDTPYGIAVYNLPTLGEGTPSQLVFGQQPTSTATTGTLAPITVDVEDSNGNLVTNDNSDVTLTIASGPTGAVMSGTTTITAVNGVATFSNLTLTTSGTYTLSATDESDTAATSISFTIYLPPETIGGLDLGFGVNGLVSQNVGFVNTLGLAEDGTQSVIIGSIGTAPTELFGITRYNSDGSLDTAFGTGGVTSIGFGSTDDVPSAVDVLADGNILVAGTATTYSNGIASGSEFAVAELESNGSLDTSFGDGGQLLVSLSSTTGSLSNDVLKSMVVGRGGMIYLGGSSDAGSTNGTDFAIAAINSSGTIDSKFGAGGKVLQSFGAGDDVINSLALQVNGDIVAAGSAAIGGITEIALARFLPSGALDKRFGTKGLVTTSVRGVYDSASSAVIQPNGRIIIGGESATASGTSLSSDFVVVRYTSTGKIDKSFGGGPVITTFGQPGAITQVLLQSNGEIVASGKTTPSLSDVTPDTLDVAVARYTTSGKLDTAFNGTGTTIINFSSGVVAMPGGTTEPLDSISLGSGFDSFNSSQQGAAIMTPSDDILDAGNSGAGAAEAELITVGVDLVTTLLNQPPMAVIGGTKGTASVEIVESGSDIAIGTVTIELEIATDAQGNGATIVKSLPVKINLRQNKDHSYKISFTYPANSPSGNYYLVALVNNGSSPALKDLNAQTELAASKLAVDITPPFISLAGSNLSAGSTVADGKSVAIIFTVTNDGNVTAKGKTTADLILSMDQTAADGTIVDAAKLSVSLLPDKSKVYRVNFKLPKTFAIGTYYLIAVIDPVDSLGAIDHSSSTVVNAIQVTVS